VATEPVASSRNRSGLPCMQGATIIGVWLAVIILIGRADGKVALLDIFWPEMVSAARLRSNQSIPVEE